MRTPALLALACASLAAACAVAPPDVPEAPPPPIIAPGVCDVAAAQFAVGQSYNTPLAEQARARAGAERVRSLQPGDMTTMEFNAARLTIDVDATGKVAGVRCG
jgi:hypothetical protein